MKTLMERAAKGHRKSEIAIYEANKDSIYAFCKLLFNDAKRAEYAAIAVINESWRQLATKADMTDDEFHRMLIIKAAKYCRIRLFRSDKRGFKIAKKTSIISYDTQEKEYTGDVEVAQIQLQRALSKLEAHHQFVYLLKVAGGLSDDEISQIISQKVSIAKYYYEKSAGMLWQILNKTDDCLFSIQQVNSLIYKIMERGKFPENADAVCLKQIKNNAKYTRRLLNKKFFIIGIGICGVILITGLVFWFSLR